MSEETPVVIGILSIGEMGLGIAKLLISHGYRVTTYAEDRRRVRAKRITGDRLIVLQL
jgi:3-hydroxyisobutyrate dehydrogenase-like beta-hydroxyacid dehydrogenase